jgi:hypothetical protein
MEHYTMRKLDAHQYIDHSYIRVRKNDNFHLYPSHGGGFRLFRILCGACVVFFSFLFRVPVRSVQRRAFCSRSY